jgi:hypothetical protein
MLCNWNVNDQMTHAIYRACTHDFEHFLYKLVNSIKYFCITKAKFFSYGDRNIILLKVTANDAKAYYHFPLILHL